MHIIHIRKGTHLENIYFQQYNKDIKPKFTWFA